MLHQQVELGMQHRCEQAHYTKLKKMVIDYHISFQICATVASFQTHPPLTLKLPMLASDQTPVICDTRSATGGLLDRLKKQKMAVITEEGEGGHFNF